MILQSQIVDVDLVMIINVKYDEVFPCKRIALIYINSILLLISNIK